MAKKTVTLTFYSELLFRDFKEEVIQGLKNSALEHHESIVFSGDEDNIHISFHDVDEE